MEIKVEKAYSLSHCTSRNNLKIVSRSLTHKLVLAAEALRELMSSMNEDSSTALILADNVEVVRTLIRRMTCDTISLQNLSYSTALMYIVWNGRVEVIRALMKRMSPKAISLQGEDGKTALMLAAENGYVEAVRALMERMSP